MMNDPEPTGVADLTVTRVFAAPRDLLWTVWTEPAHAERWWGPDGFTTTIVESDLRPGGALVREMRAPDGAIVVATGTYDEVVPPERLVTSGELERPGQPAFGIRTSVVFEEHDGKTTVTVHQTYSKLTPSAAAGAAEGAQVGWPQTFARLEAYLASPEGRKA